MSALRVPLWPVFWLIAVVAALVLRPLLPVDETRYLAVAWEMWRSGDFLVPHLNGAPYHHKPPLLFWLMTAGWSVFGLNEWWPRLVAPLFALAATAGTVWLSRALWPDDRTAASLAPVILIGMSFWAVFQTLTMFDMMLAACTVFALGAVVTAWRRGGWTGWFGFALAVGIGILAKGPAILLHVMPVALAAPYWVQGLPSGPETPLHPWRVWYARLVVATALGIGIGLAWAVPAGIAGGPEFRDMIFWGQFAGRVVDSFDHARPVWWYLVFVPPLFLPWLLWPRLWRGCRSAAARGRLSDGGVRLIAVWVLPALGVFSLISGKQLHYLLPEFCAVALLIARALSADADLPGRRRDGWVLGALFIALGALVLALHPLADLGRPPSWFPLIATGWGVLPVVAGICLAVFWHLDGRAVAMAVAASVTVLTVTVHLGARGPLAAAYDLRPIAAAVKSHQDAGRPVANFGYYHGQYHFLGRLRAPMPVVGLDLADTLSFIRDEPDGIVVAYYKNDDPKVLPRYLRPLKTFAFRDFQVVFWPASALAYHPTLADRR